MSEATRRPFAVYLSERGVSYPGLVESPATSGSMSAISRLGAARAGDEPFTGLIWTPDGVTARRDSRCTVTCVTVTGFPRPVVLGPPTDAVGSGYGLAHSLSSTTAPGSEPGLGVRSRGVEVVEVIATLGVRSRGEVMGVASVTKTAGGGGACRRDDCCSLRIVLDGASS